MASWFGMGMTLLSFIAVIFIVVRKLVFGDPVTGWASTACIITFIGGVQLFCMGIMGQCKDLHGGKAAPALYCCGEQPCRSDSD